MKRAKWDNDDYVCRDLILNGMSVSLFDIYQNVKSSKELWDSLETKYMAEDASSKNFLVSNYTNYKMTDSRPVLKQYNELLGIIGRFTQHKMNMDEAIQDNDKPKGNNVVGPSVVNEAEHKNSSRYNDNKGKHKHHDNIRVDPNKKAKSTCWKCGKTDHIKRDCKGVNVTYVSEAYFKDDDVAWRVDSGATIHSTTLVHGRGCVDLKFSSGKIVSLLNVLRVPNIRKNLVSSSVLNNCGYKQVTESNKFVLSKHAFFSISKLNDSIPWHIRLGHVHFKRMQDMSKDGSILAFDMDIEKCKTCMLTKITKKPFHDVKRETEVLKCVETASHEGHDGVTSSKTDSRVLRGLDFIFIGYAEHSKAFSLVVTEEVADQVLVQQLKPELRRSNRYRTPNSFGPECQLYLIEGTMDEVSDQHSYCFNVEVDPKTFNEAMKSQDVAF
ncbi:zinc finger, CCHC-type containing protein [Tanacetum coccineum]